MQNSSTVDVAIRSKYVFDDGSQFKSNTLKSYWRIYWPDFAHIVICSNYSSPIHTEWKVSKYRVISGLDFPVFGLNTEIYSLNLRIQSEYKKIGPEITPYLDTFHAVTVLKKPEVSCLGDGGFSVFPIDKF